MIIKNLKEKEEVGQETKGEGKRRQGKANNTTEESKDGIASDARLPTDTYPPGLGGHTTLEPQAPRGAGGKGGVSNQPKTAWDTTAADPLQ